MNDSHPQVALGATEQYFYQIHNTVPLREDEESNLLQILSSGIEGASQARDRLVEAYQPLVLSIARRFLRPSASVELLDLVQEGNLGLLDAIERYRSASGASFSTWAFSWIRGAILQAANRDSHLIRLPANKIRLLHHYEEVEFQLAVQLSRQPTLTEIATALQIPFSEMCELAVMRRHQDSVLSLQAVVEEEGQESMTLADIVPEPMQERGIAPVVLDAVQSLPKNERIVITLRFGLGGREPLSQQQVAKELEIGLYEVGLLDRRARLRLARILETQVRVSPEPTSLGA